LLLIT